MSDWRAEKDEPRRKFGTLGDIISSHRFVPQGASHDPGGRRNAFEQLSSEK
jgi:hypothetical protein